MLLNNKEIQQKLLTNQKKIWSLVAFVLVMIMACTSDLDNGGAALVGPNFGINIVPQSAQVVKAGNHTFAAIGGLTPYTYSVEGVVADEQRVGWLMRALSYVWPF
jgi:hypothetical protein